MKLTSDKERGSATAELVTALPAIISIILITFNILGTLIEHERIRFIAEGIVQASMRGESERDIAVALKGSLPGAEFTIEEKPLASDGSFTVTVRRNSTSASAIGYR